MNFFGKYKYEILIFALFVLSRIPSLGHDIFNTDVWKWKTRSYDFGSGVFNLEFEKTNQKYHPGVTLMWLGTAGVKLANVYNNRVILDNTQFTFLLHFFQKLFVVIVIGISLCFIFYVLRELFGLKYALIATFLIAVEPFYVALTRVFHLEGLLSTFMLVSVLWFFYYLKDTSHRHALVISGIFGAFSFLTKTSALYLIPFYLLVTFIHFFSHSKLILDSIQKTLKTFFIWLIIAVVGVFVLWPALWVDVTGVVQNMYRGITEIGVEGDHAQIFLGKIVNDPGVIYYPVVLLFRSSVYLLVGFIAYFFWVRDKKQDEKKFVTYLLVYAFFYTLQHTLPTKKLDRYLIPAIIGLIPITAFLYEYLLDKISFGKCAKYIIFAFLPLTTILYLHPDYLSHYNPLLGGVKTGVMAIEPKWIIGQREILSYFMELGKQRNILGVPECESYECVISSEKYDSALAVAFPEKYSTQISPFFREIGGWAIIKDLTPFAKHTRFFVYPVWSDDSHLEDRFKLRFIDSIKLRGVKVYNVYETY